MKKIRIFLSLILLSALNIINTSAQEPIDTVDVTLVKKSVVVKNDGAKYIGVIVSQDAREVLIETETIGLVYIPKHEIREIREAIADDMNDVSGEIPPEIFATRYYITTNGLPIEKGESYIQWSLYGPDFQFGLKKNFGIGVMTTWFGIPIIGSAKYSIKLGEKTNMGLGTLLGTGSWAWPDFAIALPFGAFTYGTRRNNVNLSVGYGAILVGEDIDDGFLCSIAGLGKVSKKVSMVFDSFVVTPELDNFKSAVILVIPGIRLQTESNKAFQFCFAGVYADGEVVQMPIPMIQWYRKL